MGLLHQEKDLRHLHSWTCFCQHGAIFASHILFPIEMFWAVTTNSPWKRSLNHVLRLLINMFPTQDESLLSNWDHESRTAPEEDIFQLSTSGSCSQFHCYNIGCLLSLPGVDTFHVSLLPQQSGIFVLLVATSLQHNKAHWGGTTFSVLIKTAMRRWSGQARPSSFMELKPVAKECTSNVMVSKLLTKHTIWNDIPKVR